MTSTVTMAREPEEAASHATAPCLSVIVPVFNERATVAELLARVERVPLPKEIIVVDDGSTDGTRDILRGYEDRPGYRVLYHAANQGKGHAIRTALVAVAGDVVVIQDADLEYDPQDFLGMIKPIREGRTQAVFGSRRLKKENVQHAGPIYYAGGVFLSWLTRLLYGVNITDEPTCYKMVTTEVMRSLDLRCERFEFCPELTAKLARRGVDIVEVPITYRPRPKGEGKKIGWPDAFAAIWTLLKYRVRSAEAAAPAAEVASSTMRSTG